MSVTYDQHHHTFTVTALGKTGSGKSSVLSNLVGNPKAFHSETSENRVTNHFCQIDSTWLGNSKSEELRVIDSPGLVDDPKKGEEKYDVSDHFHQFIKKMSFGVNAFLLVFNVEDIQFDSQFAGMLESFEISFGAAFWKHCAVVFTHCGHNNKDKWSGKEEELSHVINDKIAFAKLNPKNDLPCFFVDNATNTGFDSIKKGIEKFEKFDCNVMQQTRKYFEDPKNKRLDYYKHLDSLLLAEYYKWKW
eukprot:gene12748-6940_t